MAHAFLPRAIDALQASLGSSDDAAIYKFFTAIRNATQSNELDPGDFGVLASYATCLQHPRIDRLHFCRELIAELAQASLSDSGEGLRVAIENGLQFRKFQREFLSFCRMSRTPIGPSESFRRKNGIKFLLRTLHCMRDNQLSAHPDILSNREQSKWRNINFNRESFGDMPAFPYFLRVDADPINYQSTYEIALTENNQVKMSIDIRHPRKGNP